MIRFVVQFAENHFPIYIIHIFQERALFASYNVNTFFFFASSCNSFFPISSVYFEHLLFLFFASFNAMHLSISSSQINFIDFAILWRWCSRFLCPIHNAIITIFLYYIFFCIFLSKFDEVHRIRVGGAVKSEQSNIQ